MNATIVTMVIIMTIGGEDYERHERMDSLAECWKQAPLRMEALRTGKIDGVEDHERATAIGVGCVLDFGKPI